MEIETQINLPTFIVEEQAAGAILHLDFHFLRWKTSRLHGVQQGI